MAVIADDILDAVALTEALQRADADGVETLLTHGDPVGIALTACAWLSLALSRLDAESATVILDGWREDAQALRRVTDTGQGGD